MISFMKYTFLVHCNLPLKDLQGSIVLYVQLATDNKYLVSVIADNEFTAVLSLIDTDCIPLKLIEIKSIL